MMFTLSTLPHAPHLIHFLNPDIITNEYFLSSSTPYNFLIALNPPHHPQAASRGGAVYAFALEPFCLSPPGTCPHRYHAFLWIESCWMANNAAAYGGAVYSAQTV